MENLCRELQFPKEAIGYFADLSDKIYRDRENRDLFEKAVDLFYLDESDDYIECVNDLAKRLGVKADTTGMLLLLKAAKSLRYMYRQKGIDDEIFINTMMDLKYKLDESKKRYDCWGTFVLTWFRKFYQFKRFGIGRLQYNTDFELQQDYKQYAKKGDIIYNCHIPAAGPLTEELVMDSLKQAYRFFGVSGNMVVACISWLLYPPHAELFPQGSNMRKFYEMFDIVEAEECEPKWDFWRIFYCDPTEDFDSLPQETGLQRRFVSYLKAGNSMGSGTGILVFDGEKIINR